MTATRSGPGEMAESVSKEVRNALGRLRRMAVSLTSRALWQVLGHKLLDGRLEGHEVEPFTGIGFYARPKASNRVDAILHFLDGAAYPVAIAFRDEDTRKKVAADLGENETQMHNDLALFRIKANGTFEMRSLAGVALPVPTMADLNALRTYVVNQFSAANGHVHATPAGPTTAITTVGVPGTAPTVSPAVAIGTTKAKLE